MKQNQKSRTQKGIMVVLFVLVVLLGLAVVMFATPLKGFVFPAKAKPAVTLTIVEGPTLLEAGGFYEFVVEANVTGSPEPAVVFNRDDSLGEHGPMRAVIILKAGERYLLTAVARNAHGETPTSLELAAPDGGPEGDGESKIAEEPGPESEAGSKSKPKPEPNRPPVVSGLTFSAETLVTGTKYTVTASASDPDGDPLSYLWQVSGGSVANESTNPIAWTAPSAAGNCQVTVTVRDGRGGKTTAIQEVAVSEPPPENGTSIPDIEITIQPLLLTDTLSPVARESGTIVKDSDVNVYYVYAGDSTTNKIIRGFISFDISSLAGKVVHSAELRLAEPYVQGDPSFLHGTGLSKGLRLNITQWGDRPLELADFALPGQTIAAYTGYDITHTAAAGEQLVEYLQQRINSGDNRFQVRLLFARESSDNDGAADFVRYLMSEISLKITYYVPAV